MWLVQSQTGQTSRLTFDGALDVDVVFSPFFNALPIRRTALHRRIDSLILPVVYVWLPELEVKPATLSYSSEGDGVINLQSPVANTPLSVDDDGFIVEYPGLAERI
jgi:hypothetical protein